jgi:hypothetical protein
VSGCYVISNKYKDYVKLGKFLVKLSDYKPLKKVFAAECINSKK